MIRVAIKDIPLSCTKWRELRRHANGSLYRMNVLSSDCYAFRIPPKGERMMCGLIENGKDFSGGWDWVKDLCDKSAEYVYMLSDVRDLKAGNVYKV